MKLEKGSMTKKQLFDKFNKKHGNINKKSNAYSIVGGTKVLSKKYPWYCLMYIEYSDGGSFMCGGTLLPNNYVISAAHCVLGRTEKPKIYIFPNILEQSETRNVPVGYIKEIYETGYNQTTNKSDIVIMKMYDTTEFDSIPKPSLNDTPMEYNVGKQLTVVGFGTTSYQGDVSENLMEVNVNVSTQSDCNINNTYSGTDISGSFCASAPGKDSCQGDSGGPIFKDNVLYGLVSSGKGCAEEGFPGIYTDVQKYKTFIQKYTTGTQWEKTQDIPTNNPTNSPTNNPTNSPTNNTTDNTTNNTTDNTTASPTNDGDILDGGGSNTGNFVLSSDNMLGIGFIIFIGLLILLAFLLMKEKKN
jgi:secreted trypsin-like serine protease